MGQKLPIIGYKKNNMIDIYQERYLNHQLKKKNTLIKLMKKRYSERIFSDKPINIDDLSLIAESINYCPSSCNRKAISLDLIIDKDKKNLLGGLLVGGIGWIHRAPVIFLIKADPLAYKGINEINYMPYLDAGVVIQQMWLITTSLGLSASYINPNIRDFNKKHFLEVFGDGIFCGAFAIGYKDE